MKLTRQCVPPYVTSAVTKTRKIGIGKFIFVFSKRIKEIKINYPKFIVKLERLVSLLRLVPTDIRP